jgi:hypothetical protein
MDIVICSVIVAFITGVSSIITAIIWGYTPKRCKEELENLRQELLDVYKGAYNLKIVGESLEADLDISKQEARKGLIFTNRLQKSRIEKRIEQLESLVK